MINIRELKPSDVISVAEIENHTHYSIGTTAYDHAVRGLQGEISETIGCFVKQKQGTLIVLGPKDGLPYAACRISFAMKTVGSINRKLKAWISEDDLDPEEQLRYQHLTYRNSRILQLNAELARKQRRKEQLFIKKQTARL